MMKKTSFKVHDKASMSLSVMLRKRTKKQAPHPALRAAGLRANVEVVKKDDTVSLLLEVSDEKKLENELPEIEADENVNRLGENIYSARVSLATADKLLKLDVVKRLQTKKKSAPHLDVSSVNIGLRASPAGARQVQETGKGILIGVVDSGFDLTHPMFRDGQGKLRVERLLDQVTGEELSTAQLESKWSSAQNPDGPGGDENGHGTHVAGIAGGTKHKGFEGIAPEARFLLVKTNFFDTADAVRWIFQKAGSTPCVVNMSLGHHWGAHDGTEVEEQLHATLVGKGKAIVISAGNERNDPIHIGGRLTGGGAETVSFRVLRQEDDDPFAVITLWYDAQDTFEFDLITPSGQVLAVPSIGGVDEFSSSLVDLELGRQNHAGPVAAVKAQIQLAFKSSSIPNNMLTGWKLRIRCTSAVVGRIDGWFNNSGFAEFRNHALVEQARTVGLPATGHGCICVASHVAKNKWESDDGTETDTTAVVGRSSPFSSMGPTRDDRQKPEVSAPGQFVSAALAANSELSRFDERAHKTKGILSIEGTSMAAPVVAGVVALMLQKKPTLTSDRIRQRLIASAGNDSHTGAVWNPGYGNGKIDVAKALSLV